MKVSELFLRAMALLNENEKSHKSFVKNALPLVNQVLAQNLSLENGLREANGEEILKCADYADDFEHEIIYDENFVCECMPYALASLMCADDDRSMSNALGEEFEALKRKYKVVNYNDIINHY